MAGSRHIAAALVLALTLGPRSTAADLKTELEKLNAGVFPADSDRARQLGRMLPDEVRGRLHAAIERQAKEFDKVQTLKDWERFRDERLPALRESFGPLPEPARDLKLQVTKSLKRDGYRIDNVVFESRPGLIVTANLYSPEPATKGMPGIVICHGFHQPKSQGELQDMGVNWARLGCIVLVPDILGHGERRQHPFLDAKSYSEMFNPVRQDYYFRFNSGTQLHLVGQSLMGWMAWDTMRCVDVLLSRPGVDRQRIICLGAVAAGGDVAAVAAALDPRIVAVAPFNFGGPEPETPYPLPERPELSFPCASGHWDSTRRLHNWARDGFLPWVIVGAIAPRRVIYAHEFAWDREHDPAWPRLEKIFTLHGARDRLAFAHGSGTLFGKPEGTGCANIGAVHRKEMYPALQRWFQMRPPEKEAQERRPAEDLLCLTPEATKEVKPRSVTGIAWELGAQQLAAARKKLPDKPDERRRQLRTERARLLGDVEPKGEPKASTHGKDKLGDVTIERVALEVEPGITVPLLVLVPPRKENAKQPVIVGVAQQGKQEFLKQRAAAIAALLQGGAAVCLPDVRGTGETCPPEDRRGPPAGFFKVVQAESLSTMLASEELMLGRTLLGGRLKDFRAVLRYLRGRPDLDGSRIGLWGDSFAPANPPDQNVEVPWGVTKLPKQAEPLGGLLALFGALFEDEVRAVAVRGGLVGYQSILESQFVFVPADVIVPGALGAGDLSDVAAALAPRPLQLEELVDGRNRWVTREEVAKHYAAARAAYLTAKARERFQVVSADAAPALGDWLLRQMRME